MTDKPNPMTSETMPVELEPVYLTKSVNAPVCLYEGSMTLDTDGQVEEGRGSVRLDWLPVPRIAFRWQSPPVNMSMQQRLQKMTTAQSELRDATLRMEDGREVRVQVRRIHPVRTENVEAFEKSGFVKPSEFGCGDALEFVLFHVPNFHTFHGSFVRTKSGRECRDARAVMEAENWRVTLEELEHEGGSDAQRFGKQIEAAGGFGITHVGKLELSAGGCFSAADAREIEEALSWFLSFCRGTWVAPLLAVGFDTAGEQLWEEWYEWKIERWRRVTSWFNSSSCVGLVEVFPGFHRRWKDEAWNEPIRLAVHWYVESNMCAGGVEGGTILAQAALELLAWTLLVQDQQALSEDGFQKLPAYDKLRLLLSSCRIPAEIPSSLQQLAKVAKDLRWQDGPQAITELRNALAHASPKKRKKLLGVGTPTRYEAWSLALWYLELVLLWLFHPQGEYPNHLVRDGCRGREVESVPWLTTPPACSDGSPNGADDPVDRS